MKTSSKIFLIIALVVFAVGAVLMVLGVFISNSNGDSLFATTLDDGKGYCYEYEKLTGKLKIEANDAEIHIIGGADKSKIEIVNFNENLFTYTETSAMISFKESQNLGSTFQFWDGNFSFKGLRFLFKANSVSQNKKINVYLTDKDAVTDITIISRGGKTEITDVSSNTSYEFNTSSTPTKLINVATKQSIKLSDFEGQSNFALQNVTASEISVDVLKSEISGDIQCDTLVIKDSVGSANLAYKTLSFKDFYAEIDVNSKLVVDTVLYEGSYRNLEAGTALVDDDGNPVYATIDIEGDDLSVDLDTPLENKPIGDTK